MTRTLVLALFASFGAASIVQAQTSATTPSRTIRGQVVDAANGAPLRRARLTLSSGDNRLETVFTDSDGGFAIPTTSSASFTVRVNKAGYAPGLTAVPAGRGGAELRFALTRGAAVMGRVVDPYGAPLNGVHVIARLIAAGSERLPAASTQFFAPTDRFGEYRLGGIPAGRYEITAVRVPPEYREPGTKVEDQLFGPRDRLDVAERVASIALASGGEVDSLDFMIPISAQDCPEGPSTRAPEGVPPTGIRGRVTSATGEPLACATVVIRAGDVKVPQVYTDRQGRYTIEGLSKGSYILEARAIGYIPLQYGQRQPSDAETAIVLREEEARAGIDFALPRESIVTGTVTDEHGEPVEGVQVWAFQVRAVDTRSAVVSTVISRPTTDDRGRYRLIGVPPGNYVVAVLARGLVSAADARLGYVSTYYPGTTDMATAPRVSVDIGRDAEGIDITFAPRPAATVSGAVVDASGRPFAGFVTLTVRTRAGAASLDSWSAQTGVDGTFAIRSVPPGDYALKANGPEPSPLFGLQYVTVADADPPPVSLRVSMGATIEGRVIVDAAADANLAGLAVSVLPTDTDYVAVRSPRPAMFAREDDGTFRATGVRGPGRLTIAETPACDGCYLESAYVNGMDAADTPFDFGLEARVYRGAEIVVSDAGAAIEGHVRDERDAPVATFVVLVIPAHRDLWYAGSRHLKVARSTAAGSFRAAGLPPGDYVVAAVNRLDMFSMGGEGADPELLEMLTARGTRISVRERDRRSLDLRLIRR